MVTHYSHALVLVVIGAVAGGSAAPRVDPPSSLLTGSAFQYQVKQGDSLAVIGARFGIEPAEISGRNELKSNAMLAPGQILQLDNRHVVPLIDDDVVLVINVPQRMLFLDDEERVSAYPIAVGRRDWPTPLGDFTVLLKEEQPTWDVPLSIQEEMRREGRVVLDKVAPGPENPLGEFWLGLSMGAIGIHGTNAPSSIFRAATHGCIRMHADDIRLLFPRVAEGTRGRIIYEPLLLARTREGIFLEAHPDFYRRMKRHGLEMVREIAAAAGMASEIDWRLVERVLEDRRGLAIQVGASGRVEAQRMGVGPHAH